MTEVKLTKGPVLCILGFREHFLSREILSIFFTYLWLIFLRRLVHFNRGVHILIGIFVY